MQNEKIENSPTIDPLALRGDEKSPSRRKVWWEQNSTTKKYVEKLQKKWEALGKPLWILKLPRNFTCFHFAKSLPANERLHLALATTYTRPGALEYLMLEVDHIILRRAK